MNQSRRAFFEQAITVLGVGGVAAYANEVTADEICSSAKGAANPCPGVPLPPVVSHESGKVPRRYQQEWNKILTELDTAHSLTDTSDPSGKLQQRFRAIDSKLECPTRGPQIAFRSLHVEPLLNEAADLLDRCLADRSEWDAKAISQLDLFLQLNEYKELDAVHDKEAEAGFYDVDFNQSRPTLDSAQQQLWRANDMTSHMSANAAYSDYLLRSAWAAYDAAARSLPAYQSKEAWDDVNRLFRRQRTQIARNYRDLKAKAATDQDGVLNYGKRMTAIRERFCDDYAHARARLEAASQGLKDVYGYNYALPQSFDDTVLWTRAAINWLVKFSRVDQNYVLPLSLRHTPNLLSNNDWSTGLNTGKWIMLVTKDLFPNQLYIRLRGISAYVQAEDDGVWTADVQVPVSGDLFHTGGSHRVSQNLPPCRIGRAARRQAPQRADIVGTSSLYNASPIGSWNISLGAMSTSGSDRKRVKDVQIDLYLAVQTA